MIHSHLSEEDLVLVYYNEPSLAPELRSHVSACSVCQANLQALKRVLDACDESQEPARPANYEMAVWAKLRPHVMKAPRSRRWWQFSPAITAAVAIAFLGGVFFQKVHQVVPGHPAIVATASSPRARERVLLVALGDHLGRSQMVLAELVHARPQGSSDISREQQSAQDLVQENRLLRLTALGSGDTADANLLNDLERILLEVAHSPSPISSPRLRQIQERIEDQGLLFKVRIVETNLQKKENTL